MKKVLSVLLALCLLFGAVPLSASAAGEDFVIDEKGVLTKYKGSGGDVEIPRGVTRVTQYAFYDVYDKLTSVTFPDTVTSIENYPFERSYQLTRFVVDPNNPVYTSVDGVLFTKNMDEIVLYPSGKAGDEFTIPSTVKRIGNYAFFDSSLKKINLPNGLTSIGEYGLGGCPNLTAIDMPNSVVEIGDYVMFSRAAPACGRFGSRKP
ncbi:leucine-rich repeat domain-containing protein [Acutalibacter sp. 1XD8-33]|uniref:leucine-rich repeat domain-containing protein n=1 Tax=Acutalibacter sp. 1XD8-33 TaxID=2320081 RepID=UPI000EA296D4|nr:leucine-rich repeat domain-containing protein [Acutalibacter sp. 1XD8-33]RKJ38623.1 leucine-rich repeat domain-containing protein [Acutalibacter sp. 1XD8-33]